MPVFKTLGLFIFLIAFSALRAQITEPAVAYSTLPDGDLLSGYSPENITHVNSDKLDGHLESETLEILPKSTRTEVVSDNAGISRNSQPYDRESVKNYKDDILDDGSLSIRPTDWTGYEEMMMTKDLTDRSRYQGIITTTPSGNFEQDSADIFGNEGSSAEDEDLFTTSDLFHEDYSIFDSQDPDYTDSFAATTVPYSYSPHLLKEIEELLTKGNKHEEKGVRESDLEKSYMAKGPQSFQKKENNFKSQISADVRKESGDKGTDLATDQEYAYSQSPIVLEKVVFPQSVENETSTGESLVKNNTENDIERTENIEVMEKPIKVTSDNISLEENDKVDDADDDTNETSTTRGILEEATEPTSQPHGLIEEGNNTENDTDKFGSNIPSENQERGAVESFDIFAIKDFDKSMIAESKEVKDSSTQKAETHTEGYNTETTANNEFSSNNEETTEPTSQVISIENDRDKFGSNIPSENQERGVVESFDIFGNKDFDKSVIPESKEVKDSSTQTAETNTEGSNTETTANNEYSAILPTPTTIKSNNINEFEGKGSDNVDTNENDTSEYVESVEDDTPISTTEKLSKPDYVESTLTTVAQDNVSKENGEAGELDNEADRDGSLKTSSEAEDDETIAFPVSEEINEPSKETREEPGEDYAIETTSTTNINLVAASPESNINVSPGINVSEDKIVTATTEKDNEEVTKGNDAIEVSTSNIDLVTATPISSENISPDINVNEGNIVITTTDKDNKEVTGENDAIEATTSNVNLDITSAESQSPEFYITEDNVVTTTTGKDNEEVTRENYAPEAGTSNINLVRTSAESSPDMSPHINVTEDDTLTAATEKDNEETFKESYTTEASTTNINLLTMESSINITPDINVSGDNVVATTTEKDNEEVSTAPYEDNSSEYDLANSKTEEENKSMETVPAANTNDYTEQSTTEEFIATSGGNGDGHNDKDWTVSKDDSTSTNVLPTTTTSEENGDLSPSTTEVLIESRRVGSNNGSKSVEDSLMLITTERYKEGTTVDDEDEAGNTDNFKDSTTEDNTHITTDSEDKLLNASEIEQDEKERTASDANTTEEITAEIGSNVHEPTVTPMPNQHLENNSSEIKETTTQESVQYSEEEREETDFIEHSTSISTTKETTISFTDHSKDTSTTEEIVSTTEIKKEVYSTQAKTRGDEYTSKASVSVTESYSYETDRGGRITTTDLTPTTQKTEEITTDTASVPMKNVNGTDKYDYDVNKVVMTTQRTVLETHTVDDDTVTGNGPTESTFTTKFVTDGKKTETTTIISFTNTEYDKELQLFINKILANINENMTNIINRTIERIATVATTTESSFKLTDSSEDYFDSFPLSEEDTKEEDESEPSSNEVSLVNILKLWTTSRPTNENHNTAKEEEWSNRDSDVIKDTNVTMEEFINADVLGNFANVSINIKVKETSFYVPSNAYLDADLDKLILNITWPSSRKLLNNSLSLMLRKNPGFYTVQGVQLNLVEGSNLDVWNKSLTDTPANDTVEKSVFAVELEEHVGISFSNLDFLKVQDNYSRDLESMPSAIKLDAKEIGIAAACVIAALIVCATIYFAVAKSRKRVVDMHSMSKNDIPV